MNARGSAGQHLGEALIAGLDRHDVVSTFKECQRCEKNALCRDHDCTLLVSDASVIGASDLLAEFW